MRTSARYVRLLAVGWLFHLRYLSRSGFEIVSALLFPLLFATTTFFMFKAGDAGMGLLYAALGSGMLAIWDATLLGSGGAVQNQRWLGTLELLVAAPAPLAATIAPLTLATATMGLYSFAATLLWGWAVFGVSLAVVHPFAFVVAVAVTILSLGLLGTVLASTFIFLRNANALVNMLTYPMALATGLLVPLGLLPGWVTPLSWLLPPTWGMDAIRQATAGGNAWPEILICLVVGAAYGALGVFLVGRMERLAREHATLALA